MLAALLMTLCGCGDPGDSADLHEGARPAAVTLGPVAGAVTDSSAAFTLRLEREAYVSIELSEDEGFAAPLLKTEPVHASREQDRTALLRIDDLSPDTTYHYRVVSAGEVQPLPAPHSLRTAPLPDSEARFTVGLLADLGNTNTTPAPAYESLAAMEPAFVIQLGDLNHADPADDEPLIVEHWRRMHREVLRHSAAGETLDLVILSRTPFFHTWDDHDFGTDNARGNVPWKSLALQAFTEYFPLPASMPNSSAGIWYSFRWAQVEVFMLDDRSQRCSYIGEDSRTKSMLDCFELIEDQKTWLKEGLRQSTATWKLIISGSCWNPHAKTVDSWACYRFEQEELLSFFEREGITGIIVLSGDIHSGGAIDDGSHSGVVELSVPTTNLEVRNCSGGNCGDWSEGVHVGDHPAGFATATFDVTDGVHTATLATWSDTGAPRLSYTVMAP